MGEQADLTVVSWNAQGSRGTDLALAAGALAELAPDLVLLQEVQRRQLGALGEMLSMIDARWWFKHWPIRVPAEGLGILARHPITDAHVQVLVHPWAFWNWRRRIALHATMQVGDRAVQVADVHLGAGVSHEERVGQARSVLDHASGAALIAGDLNAEPASPELSTFARAGWTAAETRLRPPRTPRSPTNWVPGPRTAPPTQRLDYLLVPGTTDVLEAFVPDDWMRWAVLSDHLPVVARLVFS